MSSLLCYRTYNDTLNDSISSEMLGSHRTSKVLFRNIKKIYFGVGNLDSESAEINV